MSKRFQLVALTAAAGLLVAASAMAQGLPTNKDMLKCETGTGGALSKFTGAKTKCASKCLATQRKTMGPYTDCFAPYGGATLTCITDSVKGAEAKAAAAIVKACNSKSDACPGCFPAGACTDTSGTTNPFVHNTETTLDGFGPLTYCLEAGNNTPSKTDAKCEDGLVKNLVKFTGAKGKCYTKCLSNAFAGKIPASTCVAPATDPTTATCVSTASGKATAALDKACFTPPATFPSCFVLTTSAQWVGTAESAVDTVSAQVGCGSPSGAFLAD
jgi:hypothetical protein